MTERPVDPEEITLGEDQLPIIPHDSCHRQHMERYCPLPPVLSASTRDLHSAMLWLWLSTQSLSCFG